MIRPKRAKIWPLKVVEFYRRLFDQGTRTWIPTIQTSVKFRDFAKLYPRQFSTIRFQTWQLLILRRSFQLRRLSWKRFYSANCQFVSLVLLFSQHFSLCILNTNPDDYSSPTPNFVHYMVAHHWQLMVFFDKTGLCKKNLQLDDMRKIAVESGMFPDWFIPAFETSSFLICFVFQYSLNIIYNYWLTVIAPPSGDSYYRRSSPRLHINMFIIHSKYFPDSDWLKAHT